MFEENHLSRLPPGRTHRNRLLVRRRSIPTSKWPPPMPSADAAARAACLVANYSGSGDSGQIERLLISDRSLSVEEAEAAVWEWAEPESVFNRVKTAALASLPYPSDIPPELHSRQFYKRSLADCLISCIERLTPLGYEEGEGGRGLVVIDALQRRFSCVHGYYHLELDYRAEWFSCPKMASWLKRCS